MKNHFLFFAVGLLFLFSCNYDTKEINKKVKVFFDAKEYQKAINELDKLISYNGNDTNAYYRRGLAYLYLKNIEEAKSNFDMVISLDSNCINSYYFRANCRAARFDTDSAIFDLTCYLKKSANLKPDEKYTCVYITRGLFYHMKGQNDKALCDYMKEIELDSTNAQAYFLIGEMKFAQDSSKLEAISYIKKASVLGYEDAKQFIKDSVPACRL